MARKSKQALYLTALASLRRRARRRRLAARECDKLYATNLGAGGIDVRCERHLAEALAHPDNADSGITREDYVQADEGETCEACMEEG